MTFPIQYFPQCIREAVTGIEEFTNAPPELSASIALGVASLAVQGLYNATAHRYDTTTSLFVIVLMESGGLKSEITKLLSRGRLRFEEVKKQTFDDASKLYRAELKDWELRKASAAKIQDSRERVQELMSVERDEPVKPFAPKRVFEAPTVVGLTRAFQSAGPSIGMFSTDAGAFLSGTAMSDQAQAKQMVAIMSKVWSGEGYDRQTGDEQMEVENKRISALWLVQGMMAADFLSNPVFASQGILGRFLVVQCPRYQAPMATYADQDGNAAKLRAQMGAEKFNNRIYELLMRSLALKTGTHDELEPPVFPWDASILKMQQDWVNTFCEPYRNNCSVDDENKSFYQRLEEHCARLATIFAVMDGQPRVDHASALAAQKLVEWITVELQKIDKSAIPDTDEMKAFNALKGYLGAHKGETIRLRDITRNGRAAFTKAKENVRNAAIRRAEDEGLIEAGVETGGKGHQVKVFSVSADAGRWL